MRNLLGRLNARPPEDLVQIATAWQVQLSGGDRLAHVSQLYRALSDQRAARDLWERLPDDEQSMIRLLTDPSSAALPLVQIAERLDRSENETRQTATRLYNKGIVVREGDDDPLPVGELPRLFLPRELTNLFRRTLQEIDEGDISAMPLAHLLDARDDRELEESAERWGLRIIAGIRTRDEIARQILSAVAEPGRRTAVVEKLEPEQRHIWDDAFAAGPASTIALSDSLVHVGLDTESPETATRRRHVVGDLEESLLVLHCYDDGGERRLFIPSEIRSPQSGNASLATVPHPVAAPDVAPASRPEDAVAWDLLTFLRAVAPPVSVRIDESGTLPRAVVRSLNPLLWNRGEKQPPPGYLSFLAELADLEGILSGTDPAAREPLGLAADFRDWRDRPFSQQTARLRSAWLSCGSWIEGEERDELEVWAADWPGFRIKLVHHLGALQPKAWYRTDDVAVWLAKRDPDMLGASFQAATARAARPPDDDLAGRSMVIAGVVSTTLESAAHWFGLVDVARGEAGTRLLSVSETNRTNVSPSPVVSTEPPLTVDPDGVILLLMPTPLRVWSLSAFADQEALGPPTVYRLTESSVNRALGAGFAVGQIGAFLGKQLGTPPPAALLAKIDDWGRAFRRVRADEALLLTPGDPTQIGELLAAALAAGLTAERVGDRVLLHAEPDQATALAAIKRAGFAIHITGARRQESG